MRETTNATENIIGESELLAFLLDYAYSNDYAMALWQLPESSSKVAVLARKIVSIDRSALLEEMPGGFVLAPFDKNVHSLFLPAELQFRISHEQLSNPVENVEAYSHEWLKKNFTREAPRRSASYYCSDAVSYSKEHEYIDLVKQSIAAIGRGEFDKVVPSRTKTVPLPETFDLAAAFLKLCKFYPRAFVSLITSRETGTWMGASPEELVRIDDRTMFRTVALAGTQPYHEGVNLKKVAWTQKEIEEQALVERYIISCFKKIRLREYDEVGPKTVVAGNLMHLKSEFTVNMKETNFPQLGSTMLQLLHPTSAVCGVPLESSLAFLKQREGYTRSYYSGYLGPVNIGNQIDIFVNLRCMQLLKGKAILYAGAGVTEDSIPEQEWEETEMKMNTLLRVINSER